ncbi:MAG: hypothetical protein U5L08_11400 [Xanthomonadales bacterium]|nr:hypothetical protein [Xanthomonadales bacterium]
MPRTIVNLSEENKRWLDREARERHVSMTSLVSEAVSSYRMRAEASGRPDLQSALKDSAGLWQGGDGLAWQERLRGEWDERS